MKILQVTSFFKPCWEAGGVARVAYEIAQQLHLKSNEVTVYTTNQSIYYHQEIEVNKETNVDGMRVYYFDNLRHIFGHIPIIPYYLPVVARRDIKSYDIIHIHEYRSLLSIIVAYYARKHGVPYVIQSHGALPKIGKTRLKTIFDKVFGKHMLFEAAKVIALHEAEREQYIELGVPEVKISTIPNGINLSDYESLPDDNSFREKYHIPLSEKVILFLGRVDPIKGVDILIDAFSKFISSYPQSRLVIVGPHSNEEYMQDLNSKIETYGIGEHIIFTGPLYEREKIAAYCGSDVYVLSSRYDCFPNTVFEATACATPLIMIKESGCSGLIQNLGCGCFINSGDVDDLTSQLLHVFENYGEHLSAAKTGRVGVFDVFSWDKVSNVIMNEVYLPSVKSNNL